MALTDPLPVHAVIPPKVPAADAPPPAPLEPDRAKLLDAFRYVWEWLMRLDETQAAGWLVDYCTPYILEDAPELEDVRAITAKANSHFTSPNAYRDLYDRLWEAECATTVEQLNYANEHSPRSVIARALLQKIGAETVLDMGCGSGFLTLWLAHHGFRTTGLGLMRRALDAARESAKNLGVPASFICQHAEAYRGEFVDAVIAFEIIEHVCDPTTLIASMEANCRPGGLCLLSTPVGSTTYGQDTWANGITEYDGSAHVRAYTQKRLRALIGDRLDFTLDVVTDGQHGSFVCAWRMPV